MRHKLAETDKQPSRDALESNDAHDPVIEVNKTNTEQRGGTRDDDNPGTRAMPATCIHPWNCRSDGKTSPGYSSSWRRGRKAANHTSRVPPTAILQHQHAVRGHRGPLLRTGTGQESEPYTSVYPLEGLKRIVMQDTNPWLEGLDHADDNNWLSTMAESDQRGPDPSPLTSTATDPRTTQRAVYKPCKCPSHQRSYDAWPTQDAEAHQQ